MAIWCRSCGVYTDLFTFTVCRLSGLREYDEFLYAEKDAPSFFSASFFHDYSNSASSAVMAEIS